MAGRSYAQYCALAKALDVIGERWTLLIVRDLLVGPKRYKDLIDGLAGISTDILAARLKDLEKAGLVTRRALPPPSAATVYELTAEGAELEPVILSLANWGLRRLGDKAKDEEFRIEWLELALRSLFRAEHAQGPPLTLDFQVSGQRLRVRVADGKFEAGTRLDEPADVTIVSDMATLVRVTRDPSLAGQAFAKGKLRVSGSPEARARMNDLFQLATPAQR